VERKVKLLVLDVLKPHEPDVVRYAQDLADLEGVTAVNISVVEVDSKTESLKMIVRGNDLSLEAIREAIRELGGSVHSVDRVVVGKLGAEDVARVATEI